MIYKKAQGLSINTIVVAAIALLVLIVLAFIFGNKSGEFVTRGNQCEAVGGSCNQDSGGLTCNPGFAKHVTGKCDDDGPCCIQIFEDDEP